MGNLLGRQPDPLAPFNTGAGAAAPRRNNGSNSNSRNLEAGPTPKNKNFNVTGVAPSVSENTNVEAGMNNIKGNNTTRNNRNNRGRNTSSPQQVEETNSRANTEADEPEVTEHKLPPPNAPGVVNVKRNNNKRNNRNKNAPINVTVKAPPPPVPESRLEVVEAVAQAGGRRQSRKAHRRNRKTTRKQK